LKTRAKNFIRAYEAVAIVTPFWRPKTDYIKQIINAIRGKVQNGDIVTLSEKAISTASGNIIDESTVEPGSLARFLAKYWMRLGWGYFLGPLCHLRKRTIARFRDYPIDEGAKHKQVALEECGMSQALMHGSEGGIDGSNLAYSFVSLPLKNAHQIAEEIREKIEHDLGKKVVVMITDTDKTYSFRNFHFTPRPHTIRGIQSRMSFCAYTTGRIFRLRKRATPIAISDSNISVNTALWLAERANKARGFGAGRNVWDMADKLKVSLTEVTWEMLEEIEHKPIVILRRK
jgi:F420-0:gamma-glutamyl ligase-like protein